MRDLLVLKIAEAGVMGIAPEAIAASFPGISRSTLNRRLADLCRSGQIKSVGATRSRRYLSTTPLSSEDIDAHFAVPPQARPVARFNEDLLDTSPGMDPDRAARCTAIQALAQPLDRKYLAEFLVDFSWGSSLLEGSSYSALDTAALIEYGQPNAGKPIEDAALALNHKRAGEHLWEHRALSFDNICQMHGLLTDDHALPAVAGSDHFLPAEQRGRPREFEEVSLHGSAYLPPFRPGTGHATRLLQRVIALAVTLHPVQAAFYLLTRIAYIQSFANGNKRTSRIAADIPLLASGLIPLSFVDVDKADYIRGVAAFYELGSTHVIEQTFIRAYAKSTVRSSRIPDAMRVGGFKIAEVVDLLVDYINTGRRPTDPRALAFLV